MQYIAQTVFTPNDLKHYGVPGMKWGQHRAKSQNGNNKKRTNRKRKTKLKKQVKKATIMAAEWANEHPEQVATALSIASALLGEAYGSAKNSYRQNKANKNADKIKAYDDMKDYYIRKQNKYENAYTNTTNKALQKRYEDGYNKADSAALGAYKKANKLRGL